MNAEVAMVFPAVVLFSLSLVLTAFSLWMAGGGIKRGYTHGETDELGYNVVRDPVHVHDFQATLLHLLGIDHERLLFKHQGRRYRLTDVSGHVVKELLA